MCAAIGSSDCTANSGLFVAAATCDSATGLCPGAPPPFGSGPTAGTPSCGDGVLDAGEECEADADCNTPVEGCSECHCIGAVLVALRWTNDNDLNLRVIDPQGTVFAAPVDANAHCIGTTNVPEEDIFFPPGRAALGCYRVEATFTARCRQAGNADTHLDLRLNVEGDKATLHDVPGPAPGQTFVTSFGVRSPGCGSPPPLP